METTILFRGLGSRIVENHMETEIEIGITQGGESHGQ